MNRHSGRSGIACAEAMECPPSVLREGMTSDRPAGVTVVLHTRTGPRHNTTLALVDAEWRRESAVARSVQPAKRTHPHICNDVDVPSEINPDSRINPRPLLLAGRVAARHIADLYKLRLP